MQVELGDPRRTRRVQAIVAALREHPDASYPDAFPESDDLEGFYRTVRSSAMSVEQLLAEHRRCTVRRAATVGEVVSIHDTTEFAFPLRQGHLRKNLCRLSSKQQGFFGHVTLLATADGLRAPLGTLGLYPYVHEAGLADDEAWRFWALEYGAGEVESARWLAGVRRAEAVMDGAATMIHVMDREADIYALMAPMAASGVRFVVRAAQDRRVEGAEPEEVTRLFAVMEGQPELARRVVEVGPRSAEGKPPGQQKAFPARPGRKAMLAFRATTVEVCRPLNRTDLEHLPATVSVNVVEAREVEVPEGEEPVYWLLLTTEPVGTVEAVLRVVDLYRSRWLVEEFFKAIKTGCGFCKAQLEEAQHLLIALTLTLPVAWQLLVMRHLDRACPEADAEAVVSPRQLAVLRQTVKKMRWSARPTVGEATAAIARLGGHLRSNGRPGWQVLGRGYQKLLALEEGWQAAMEALGAGTRVRQ
jgi:hypothetical protein